jgi:MFS family permease
MQRVSANLAVAIGPAIGGLLASQSFLWLFIIDAATSLITAVIVYFTLPETKPEATEDQPEESISQSFGGYKRVFQDRIFIAFLLVSMLTVLVYTQMNSTLSVYLRDVHGVTLKQFGLLLSMNAAMVVIFQFWITRRVSKRSPMLMMALGTVFYGIGFAMYGIFGAIIFFVIAMILITIGEMITVPVAQALVVRFSPEDMRGRYMAIYGFSWTIPFAFGPLMAGLVIDNLDPRLVWYAAGVISIIAVLGFLLLNGKIPAGTSSMDEEQDSPEPVPEAQEPADIVMPVVSEDII